MEINDLIIFKTVASEGSISKAAKELGYVQPNVTERIKKLEQELKEYVREDLDSILIFKNSNKKWLKKEYIGIDGTELVSNFF